MTSQELRSFFIILFCLTGRDLFFFNLGENKYAIDLQIKLAESRSEFTETETRLLFFDTHCPSSGPKITLFMHRICHLISKLPVRRKSIKFCYTSKAPVKSSKEQDSEEQHNVNYARDVFV